MQLWALSNSSRFRYIQIETLESGSNKILRLSSSELRVLTSQNSETYDVASRAWRSLHSHVECCGSLNPAWILLIRGDLELRTFLVPFTGFFWIKKLLSPWKIFGKTTISCRERGCQTPAYFLSSGIQKGAGSMGSFFPVREVRDVQDATCRMMHPSFRVPCYTRIYVGHIMTHHDASLLCD